MNSGVVRRTVGLFLAMSLFLPAFGQVRLPRLISDGMVLQRGAQANIWGWAAQGEAVTVHFRGSVYQTRANENGEWKIVLSGLKAGGPDTLQIVASNQITLNDVLVGDVWVCSGQSNMELSMSRASPLYQDEIASSENSQIRHFAVPQKYDFNRPYDDLMSGTWKKADPENVLTFSAVAYFFGRELYAHYKVPIGLLNASLGGAPAEAFMSEKALEAFPDHLAEARRFKDATAIVNIETADRVRIDAWYQRLREIDKGHPDTARSWYSPECDTTGWSLMNVPGYWADQGLGAVNGVIWFRREFDVPASFAGKPARLNLGRIVDADSVFVNGMFIGTTSYQYPPRRYDVPSGVLTGGKNVLVVRVINSSGKGGFVPDKAYELVVGDRTIDLKGTWLCKVGATMEPLAGQTFIRWKPLGLYNGMIAPLRNFSMKGVIWYQGESNARRPVEYRSILPALIQDWRAAWRQGDFPFLFVQLPNYMEAKAEPSESNWAMLREAQARTLSVPKTGMAVTIDIGEWNDIHPLNKKDVGRRLALAARKVAYGEKKIVHSGPTFKSAKTVGSKIIITFNNIGNGLVARGGELKQFAISRSDKHFVWAHAKIENNTVVVWSENIPNPVAVRYAWADNPEGANLYNKEGLPASPFRTEE